MFNRKISHLYSSTSPSAKTLDIIAHHDRTTINTRNQIINTLEIFASEQRQIDYKKSVPFVHIPDEIIAQWHGYQELNKRDWYIKIWHESELKSIENFDLTLKPSLNCLSNVSDIPEILLKKEWTDIMEAADECLKCLNSNYA